MNGKSTNPKSKTCKSCAFRAQIYRKYGYYISPFKRYFCTETDKYTELTDTCDRWQKKSNADPDLSPERLDKAEEDMKAIIDILKT